MEDQSMFDIYVESIRALVTGILFLYFLWIDRNEDFRGWNGWLFILNGFFLLTFATVIDITDNFSSLEKYIIIGPTLLEAFLEKIIGYLLGSILLAIGFFRFLPIITKLRRETSARKKAEKFTRSILSAVDEGFLVIDSHYRILSANNAFLNRAGISSEEAFGKKCYEVSHQSKNACYEKGEECAVKNTFLTGKPHTAIHKHYKNDGSVYFPETDRTASGAEKKLDSALSGSGKTILLAEDDEHIRRLMSSCLGEFGYNVLEALDGDEAVDIFKEKKEEISLVIVDYMMPGKTGNEVCRDIKKMKSDVNLLFISGFANDVIDEVKSQIEGAEILYKPVSPEKLLSTVRNILKRKNQDSLENEKLI